MTVTVTTFGVIGDTPGNIKLTDTNSIVPTVFPSYYLQPNLKVVIVNSFDDSTIVLRASVIEVTINYGYDLGVSTAEVQLTADPNVSNYSSVKIYGGCDPNGPNYEALRFSGLFLRTEAAMWPYVYTMVCRGNLYRALQYRQAKPFVGMPAQLVEGPIPYGIPLVNTIIDGQEYQGYLNGQLGVDSTDENIVTSILQIVPELDVVPANVNGSGSVIVYAALDLIWPPYMSAWDMVQKLDQAFLGYRTYEDLGGTIRRERIFGYPHGISDTQFTEGIDVWEAHGTRTIEPLINGVYVEGLTDSRTGIPAGLVFAYVQEANPFQPADQPVIEQFQSPFAETSDLIDALYPTPQPRLNANRVAEWRLAEGNRQLVNVQVTTFRDDLLFIGHTISINIPHAAVQEPVWIQHVTIKASSQPSLWQQTISGIGGGAAGFGVYSGVLADDGSTDTVLATVNTYVASTLFGLTIILTNPDDPDNYNVVAKIIANDSNSITVDFPFPTTPQGGSTYSIGTPPPPGTS